MSRPAALALFLLLLPVPAPAQDAAEKGPPAFVPLEHPAAAAALASAARIAAEGRAAEAAEEYQRVADGALAERLAALPRHPDTLEQARERAHREVALSADLRAAHRKRYSESAESLLRAAIAAGDERALRQACARFPLTDAGARAGLLLARAAHRRGDAGECLGILERLRDLHGGGAPPSLPAADFAALEASAAAASGDAEGLDAAERAGRALGEGAALSGGAPLADHLAACRRSLPAPFQGPRGPLALLWSWKAPPAGRDGREDEGSFLPVNESDLPPPTEPEV